MILNELSGLTDFKLEMTHGLTVTSPSDTCPVHVVPCCLDSLIRSLFALCVTS
jgi:hypothetical protein